MERFPTEEMPLTHILVVRDIERSRSWYADVLGAQLHREYGGDSTVLSFNGSWLLLVTGAGPTEDKPTITLAAPADGDRSTTCSRSACRTVAPPTRPCVGVARSS